MQLQNQALSEDVARIRRLRDKIEEESKKSPANQALISSLQGELAAVQAKYQGEGKDAGEPAGHHDDGGEENVGESFRAAAEGAWVGANRTGLREFGAAFGR